MCFAILSCSLVAHYDIAVSELELKDVCCNRRKKREPSGEEGFDGHNGQVDESKVTDSVFLWKIPSSYMVDS